MKRTLSRLGTFLCVVSVVALYGTDALSADLPRYADEQEERLKEVDGEVIDAQIARFRAIFAKDKDEEEIKRLNKKFKKLQKTRRELLRSTGKAY